MSFYKTFGTSEELENGKGLDLDYGDDGVITIHRAGGSNKKYTTVAAQKLKPYARKLQNGTADADTINKVMAEIYADSIIIGWKGVKDAEGKALKFTKENVVKLLTDLPDLFEDIQDQATKLSNFRAEQNEEISKN
jgi:hypothetical protein